MSASNNVGVSVPNTRGISVDSRSLTQETKGSGSQTMNQERRKEQTNITSTTSEIVNKKGCVNQHPLHSLMLSRTLFVEGTVPATLARLSLSETMALVCESLQLLSERIINFGKRDGVIMEELQAIKVHCAALSVTAKDTEEGARDTEDSVVAAEIELEKMHFSVGRDARRIVLLCPDTLNF